MIENLEDQINVEDMEPEDGDEVKGSISVVSSEIVDSIPARREQC